MKRLCLIITLYLSGCSNTVTKLDLNSQKEDIFNTTIVFIEKNFRSLWKAITLLLYQEMF